MQFSEFLLSDLSIMCQCTSQLSATPLERSEARAVQVTFIFATTGAADSGAGGEEMEKKTEKFQMKVYYRLEIFLFFVFFLIV